MQQGAAAQMDTAIVVPPQITTELTQILSNLVLGDNEIRASAEKAVNERLAHTPELYLLALAQFSITADTDVMRSFSLVLLRRLLFRSAPLPSTSASSNSHSNPPHPPSRPHQHVTLTLYDHLSNHTLLALERLLLLSLERETAMEVRRNTVDTICDVATQGMLRGRMWHALQEGAFGLTQVQEGGQAQGDVPAPALRMSAFRIFAGCPNLVMDLQIDAVVGVLQRGLMDSESVTVRHAALLASVAYLTAADPAQLTQAGTLIQPMLLTLPSLASSLHLPPLGANSPHPPKSSNFHYLSTFLSTLTPLCTTHPTLFTEHLGSLLMILPGLMMPVVDCGPTPTIGRPFPGGGGGRQTAFEFPPPTAGSSSSDPDASSSSNTINSSNSNSSSSYSDHADEDADERSTLRLSALEFMLSLCEGHPGMVKKVSGWVEAVVRACLEGMGELEEDEGWVGEDPSAASSAAETDSPPALYEQSLDRLAIAMGGRAVLPSAFQYIPSMLANYDWRVRHAGLMAVAAIGEGTGKVMLKELDKIVELVTPMFNDSHPRVRYAACQCVGQLCTDLEENMQQKYHERLFGVLIPALEDPEPRVHAHAAAALINFCEGVERDTLLPYLDPIVERLLKMLNPDSAAQAQSPGEGSHPTRRYVQEQAVTTLAMVADASEGGFGRHYPTIMPLLLNVLRHADGPEYRKLRAKAMECAGLIAIAVGPDVFRSDSGTLIELLIRVQQSPLDPADNQLSHYLMATWAKVCQAMGVEFEPYLPVVMPGLLAVASAKADLSVYNEEDDRTSEDREGVETIVMDGQTYGVRTSVMDEKCQAFETLVIYCSTLKARFAPYLAQSLEVALPCLRFYFHEGVREACVMLIPMLLSCGATSNTLTHQMVSATFLQLINCISAEHDATFLASLFRYFSEALRVVGGPEALSPQFHDGIIEATKRQLHAMADRRKARAARAQSGSYALSLTSMPGAAGGALSEWDRDDMALVEEIEDYALEDMGKMLASFDLNHPLLVAVAGVRDLGFNKYDSDEEGEDDG